MLRLVSICLLSTLAATIASATTRRDECLDFSRYPAAAEAVQPFARPDTKSSKEVHRFRAVILAGAEGEPNFAGRFRVVEWGCGSNCHQFAIVDKKTGHVFLVEEAAAMAASFRLDSNLFILDPPDVIPVLQADLFSTMSFFWDDSSRSLRPIPGCGGQAQPTIPPDPSRQAAPGR